MTTVCFKGFFNLFDNEWERVVEGFTDSRGSVDMNSMTISVIANMLHSNVSDNGFRNDWRTAVRDGVFDRLPQDFKVGQVLTLFLAFRMSQIAREHLPEHLANVSFTQTAVDLAAWKAYKGIV